MKVSKVKMPDGRLVDAQRDMLVEYTGPCAGIVRYRGPSGASYRFSVNRKQRTVCAVDAVWFARMQYFVIKEMPELEAK